MRSSLPGFGVNVDSLITAMTGYPTPRFSMARSNILR